MSIRGDGIKNGMLWRWLVQLLLLCVVVRALVPLGYMPDRSATSKGVFKFVICSAIGGKSITYDADGKPLPSQQASHHVQPCAFAGLAVVALPALGAIQLSAPEFQASALILQLAVRLPPSRAGPPLGSRGPPQIS